MTPEREALTDLWHAKLHAASQAYQAAKIAHADAQKERPYTPRADGAFLCIRTLMAETAALAEYYRVLRIHGALVIRGERPPADT